MRETIRFRRNLSVRERERTLAPLCAKDTGRFRTPKLGEEKGPNNWNNEERMVGGVLDERLDGHVRLGGLITFTATTFQTRVRW